MSKFKTCSRCGEEKPRTVEVFGKRKSSKDGFNGMCKSCISEQKKQYYEENRDAILVKREQYRNENKDVISAGMKQYYRKNKDAILEYHKTYRQENKDMILDKKKQYYEENKDAIAEYNKRYYEENRDVFAVYNKRYHEENKNMIMENKKRYYEENKDVILWQKKRYRQENPHIGRMYSQIRRTRKAKLEYTLTTHEWNQTKDSFNNSCSYCGMTEQHHIEETGQQLHQDHFVPLSRGGEYTHNNIVPACRSCNSSKRDSDFFEWYPTYEHYNKDREQKILEFLGYENNKTQQLSIL